MLSVPLELGGGGVVDPPLLPWFFGSPCSCEDEGFIMCLQHKLLDIILTERRKPTSINFDPITGLDINEPWCM